MDSTLFHLGAISSFPSSPFSDLVSNFYEQISKYVSKWKCHCECRRTASKRLIWIQVLMWACDDCIAYTIIRYYITHFNSQINDRWTLANLFLFDSFVPLFVLSLACNFAWIVQNHFDTAFLLFFLKVNSMVLHFITIYRSKN